MRVSRPIVRALACVVWVGMCVCAASSTYVYDWDSLEVTREVPTGGYEVTFRRGIVALATASGVYIADAHSSRWGFLEASGLGKYSRRNALNAGLTHHRTRHTAHGTRHTAHGTRHTAHGTRHTAHGTRHTAHGTRHTAHGTRHTHAPPHTNRHAC